MALPGRAAQKSAVLYTRRGVGQSGGVNRRVALIFASLPLVVAGLSGTTEALAQQTTGAPAAAATNAPAAPGEQDPVYRNYETGDRRRDGVLVFLHGGFSLGHVAGYPTDVKTLNQPGFRSATPLLGGYTWGVGIGGSLADTVNVGVFFQRHEYSSPSWNAHTSGGGLRVDLFPFVHAVPALADVGFAGSFGVGSTYAKVKKAGDYPDAAGTQSFIGVAAFWEHRLGPLGLGPELRVDYVPSTYADGLSASLSLRISGYTAGRGSKARVAPRESTDVAVPPAATPEAPVEGGPPSPATPPPANSVAIANGRAQAAPTP